MTELNKPDCYKCVHRRTLNFNAHSRCNNFGAKVEGNAHGMEKGWFMWPFNFDPTWLVSCNSFSADPKDNMPDKKADPLAEVLSLLLR
jgi:hypothetical protein